MVGSGATVQNKTSADSDVRLTAIGAVSEALMALYGIARMLKSRELSGAKVLPAVTAFADDVRALQPQLRLIIATLGNISQEELSLKEAVTAMREPAFAVVSQLEEEFAGQRNRRKLNARDRLHMEMKAVQLGGELEAIRTLINLLYASLEARPADLSVADVVTGRWCNEPTFGSQPIDLALDLPDGIRFLGDPRVTWGLLEGCLRWLLSRGVDCVQLRCFSADDDRAVYLQLQPCRGEGSSPELPVQRLSLGVHLPVERVVFEAVARHRAIGLTLDQTQNTVTLRV